MSNEPIQVSAGELRVIIRNILAETIQLRRASETAIYGIAGSEPSVGEPTDEEIDDFLFCNPLLDSETVNQLTDEGLLGFFGTTARTNKQWLDEFRDNVTSWAHNNSWLSGDAPLLHLDQIYGEAAETELWTPKGQRPPGWVETSSSYLLVAADLLKQGRLISDMHWRDYEKLIGELLESEGWRVEVTRGSKDGGIDVIAEKSDSLLGEIRTLWQAKKYGVTNKVKLSEVRELSAIRDNDKATKAVIVTTSHLTRDAIEWVKRDKFRLDYRDKERIESWIRLKVFGQP